MSEIPEGKISDGVLLAVDHKAFANITASALRAILNHNVVIYDCQSFFDKDDVDGRL